MDMIRYSPSTKGFYAYDIDYTSLPDDVLDITKKQHAMLLAGEASGKEIDFSTHPPTLKVRPAVPEPVLSPAEKLEQLTGLSVEEIKSALGI